MTSKMYVDMIYSRARSFAPFGNPSAAIGDTLVAVKADGWPATDFSMTLATLMNTYTDDDGVYEGSFTGQVSAVTGSDCTVSGLTYNAGTNTSRFQVTIGTANSTPTLSFAGISGDFANLRLIIPGYPWDTPKKYSDEWLALMRPYSHLRMMDITRTSGTALAGFDAASQVSWGDRWTGTSTTAGQIIRKWSWEEVVDIANTLGKDAWVCLPHPADDSYVTGLATFLRDNLNPGVNVYFEISNEIWNSSAAYQPQFQHFQQLAINELGIFGTFGNSGTISSAVVAGGVCTITFSAAHGKTSGQSIKARIGASGVFVRASTYTVTVTGATTLTIPVAVADGSITITSSDYVLTNTASNLAYDFENNGINQSAIGYRVAWRRLYQSKLLFDSVFSAGYLLSKVRFVAALQMALPTFAGQTLDYLYDNYGAVSGWLYAISPASYISASPGNATVDAVFASMATSQETMKDQGARWIAAAKRYGVKCIQYEAGPDTAVVTNKAVSVLADVDARMQPQVVQMCSNAAAMGYDAIAYYSVGANPGFGGSFDLLRKIEDTRESAPRLAGVQDSLAASVPAIDSRFVGLIPATPTNSTTWATAPFYVKNWNSAYWNVTGAQNMGLAPQVGGSPVDVAFVFYIATDGSYTLTPRACRFSAGGTIEVDLDGVNIATGAAIANQNDFSVQAAQMTPLGPVALKRGFHVLRLYLPGLATVRYGFSQLTIR